MFKKICFLLFIFLIFFIPNILAVGIGEYTKEKETLYQEGKEIRYKFYLFDALKISIGLEGDLLEYATIVDPNPGGGPRNIEIIFNIPKNATPGTHTMFLSATEAPLNEGTVGGIASVRTGFRIVILYPGKYPTFYPPNIRDINVNEKANVEVSIMNYGRDTIIASNSTITIYNEENNTIEVLKTNNAPVWPYESRVLKTVFDTSAYNLSPGTYRAVATYGYDGIDVNESKETTFMVGELRVSITGTTSQVYVNSTNKYHIHLESDWAGKMSEVYAKIHTPNNKNLKTPNIELEKNAQGQKATGTLETYWETDGLDIGEHTIDITVYYSGLTTTQTVPVEIIEGKAPDIEKPKSFFNFSTTTGIVLLIVAILLPTAIYFYMRIGKKDDSENILNNDNVNDDDIRPPTL